jgi:hypothetical protein
MSYSSLVRSSGLPVMLGGVLLLAVVFVDIITIDFVNLGDEATTTAFRFYSVLSLIAVVLLLIGSIGLYFRQSEKVGPVGLVGFLLAFTGTVLVAGAFWAQTFGAMILAERAPQVLNDPYSGGWLGPGFILSISLFALGWLWFGVVTLWHRDFHPVAALLLILGSALSFAPLPYSESLFAVAMIWLGFDLLAERKHTS